VSRATIGETPELQPRVLQRIQEILNTVPIRTDQDLVHVVEARLPTEAIDGLRRSGVTDDELYGLVVPRRTLSHRRSRREALSQDESDRAVRLARTTALAEHVFGDAQRAWRWLRAPKRQFRGRSPVRLLATETGARLVEELLYRVDEGMAA
jgi:putative toxin-antitoxin system antitoxin component (TIGR02293 family)